MSTPDYILIGMAFLSVLMYIALVLEGSIPSFALLLLPFLWLLYWIKNGRLSFSSPLDFPILALLIVASQGIWISPYQDFFLPKFSGLLIGVCTYYIIVNFLRYRQRLSLIIFALIFLSLSITFLAIIATEWPVGNHSLFDRIYQSLPDLSNMVGAEKINKNTIGGTLAFFPPLLLSLLWDHRSFSRFKSNYARLSNLPGIIYKALLLFALFLVLFALLLTQSRGAWLGCAAGIFLILVLNNKHFLWLLPLFFVFFLIILFWRADGSLVQLLSLLDTSQEATLPSRLEIWQKALIILRDFPATGIGLGAFGELYRQYFASIIFPSATDVVFHAHNTLLSVGVEVGFPGLILYAGLLGGFVAIAYKTIKTKRSVNRVLAIGLVGGLAAFLVFGLLDAFTLGKNLDIIFWIFLGILSALYVNKLALSTTYASYRAFIHENELLTVAPELRIKRLKFLVSLPLIWLILVLFSLSCVNLSVTLAFIFTVLLGLFFGYYQVKYSPRKIK